MDVSFTVDSLLANFGTAKRQTLKGFVEGFCWGFGAAKGLRKGLRKGYQGWLTGLLWHCWWCLRVCACAFYD